MLNDEQKPAPCIDVSDCAEAHLALSSLLVLVALVLALVLLTALFPVLRLFDLVRGTANK